MLQGFLLSRSQSAFSLFYGRYNDLVCRYNLPSGQILSDVFGCSWRFDFDIY
jgi:hypothetical protein